MLDIASYGDPASAAASPAVSIMSASTPSSIPEVGLVRLAARRGTYSAAARGHEWCRRAPRGLMVRVPAFSVVRTGRRVVVAAPTTALAMMVSTPLCSAPEVGFLLPCLLASVGASLKRSLATRMYPAQTPGLWSGQATFSQRQGRVYTCGSGSAWQHAGCLVSSQAPVCFFPCKHAIMGQFQHF